MAASDALTFADWKPTALVYLGGSIVIGSFFYFADYGLGGTTVHVKAMAVDFLRGSGITFGIVFIITSLLAPFKIHAPVVIAFDALKKTFDPRMEFFVDQNSDQHVAQAQGYRELRVGIRNTSNSEIGGIRIRCRSFSKIHPKRNSHLCDYSIGAIPGLPLARKNKAPVDEEFPLAPREHFDIRVVADGVMDQGMGKPPMPIFRFYHAADVPGQAFGQNYPVPRGCYRMVLEAFGSENATATIEFFVGWSAKRGLILVPVKKPPGTNPPPSRPPR